MRKKLTSKLIHLFIVESKLLLDSLAIYNYSLTRPPRILRGGVSAKKLRFLRHVLNNTPRNVSDQIPSFLVCLRLSSFLFLLWSLGHGLGKVVERLGLR